MNTDWIEKATFSEICRSIEKRDSKLLSCINGIVELALLIFPVLPCKEFDAFNTSIMLTDIKTAASEAVKKVHVSFPKKHDDFSTRYDNVRIAHVLLVFAAYFDSIKLYLPDEYRAISLSPTEKIYITEQAMSDFLKKQQEQFSHDQQRNCRKITEYEFELPNPIEGLMRCNIQLHQFYSELNPHFLDFINGLGAYEQMNDVQKEKFHAYLNVLPELAVHNYEKQFYTLSAEFPDFFAWANHYEHKLLDVGFQNLSKKIDNLTEHISSEKTHRALSICECKYRSHVTRAIVNQEDMPHGEQDIRLPSHENSFIPQDFKALVYRRNKHLTSANEWNTSSLSIGEFITHTLRSPEIGKKPMLILGHPGAGKTTLCYMLAAKLLYQEYHTIILNLRDIPPNLQIHELINTQLRNNGIDYCTWSDITFSKPKKPILLIFDGFDELLQASGQSHADFIERISSFQQNQRVIFGFSPRCVITSRFTLIDRARIPYGCAIIKLEEFIDSQIWAWTKIWNEYNNDYFKRNGLKPFDPEDNHHAWELAKQPLLLLMLAIFDSTNNDLHHHSKLTMPQLYNALINKFIEREATKRSDHRRKTDDAQHQFLEEEYSRLCIAALGIFNRADPSLCIREEQLSHDLIKLLGKPDSISTELTEGMRLLGRFFFLQRPSATTVENHTTNKSYAYVFLHKTIYEFLTAHYIVQEVVILLNNFIKCKRERISLNIINFEKWYAALSYSPLFHEPNIIDIIQTWFPLYVDNQNLHFEDYQTALDDLLRIEIPKILSGKIIHDLEKNATTFSEEHGYPPIDPTTMLATYSNNLVSLVALLMHTDSPQHIHTHDIPHITGYPSFHKSTRLPLYKIEQYDYCAWNKLLHLWRYAFGESGITNFTKCFEITNKNNQRFLQHYHLRDEYLKDIFPESDSISRRLATHYYLSEDWEYVILGVLAGSNYEKVIELLTYQQLNRKAFFSLRYFVDNYISFSHLVSDTRFTEPRIFDNPIKFLSSLREYALKENDDGSFFVYYLIISHLATHPNPKISIKNLIVVENLLSDFQYISTKWPIHAPDHVLPLILEILLLHPTLNRQPWDNCNRESCDYNQDITLFKEIVEILPHINNINVLVQENVIRCHAALLNRMLIIDSKTQLLYKHQWFADAIRIIGYSIDYIFQDYNESISTDTMLEILRLADNLIKSNMKQSGKSILDIYLNALNRSRFGEKCPVHPIYAEPLLSALKNYFGQGSKNIGVWLSWIPQPNNLITVSLKAIVDLCALAEVYPKALGIHILPNLISMLNTDSDKISIQLYNSLSKLAITLNSTDLVNALKRITPSLSDTNKANVF